MIFLAATVVSALLTWTAFSPVGWAPMVFIGPAPFLWALRRVALPRQAMGLGFLWGSLFFGVLLFWVGTVGIVAWVPLIIGLASYASVYALILWLVRQLPLWRWWVVAVGGWALWEFVRARWFLGGFPWGSLGYPAAAMPWPRSATQWIGSTGLGVLVVAVAAGLVLVFDERPRQRFFIGSVTAVLAISVAGAVWSPARGGAEIRVAIVQGSTPCPRVHCLDEKQLIYESHIELTRSIPGGAVDLVVWGENATGGRFEPVTNPEIAVDIAQEARRLSAYMMVSGTRNAKEPDKFINANLLFDPEGEFIGEYRKRHPVPFGEFVPLREYLDWIPQLEQVPRDMVRGDNPVVWDLPGGTIGSVISYEGGFAREVRSTAKAGAQLITVNTNESSYGRTPASDQLIDMTRVGAAENGVYVIHAAISGKSAIIDAEGEILDVTGLFSEELLVGSAVFRAGRGTFYTRTGDWLQLLAIGVGTMPFIFWGKRRRSEYLFGPASDSWFK